MYNVVSNIVEVLIVFFQGYCLQSFYHSFMKTRREGWLGSRYGIFIIWVVMRLLMGYFWTMDYNQIKLQGKQFLTIAVLLVATYGLYEARRGMKAFLAITFLAVNEICLLISFMILEFGGVLFSLWSWCLEKRYVTSINVFMMLTQATAAGLMILTLVAFSLLLYNSLKSITNRYREKEYAIHRTELFFILTPGMTALLLCLLLRMLMVTVEDKIPMTLYDRYPVLLVLVPVILVLSLFSIICSVQLFQRMIRLNREKSNRIILEKQLQNMQEHIGEVERLYSGIRSVRHDMKNQLAVAMQLAGREKDSEGEELRTYLAGLNQALEDMEIPIRTGNTVVDTILNMKYHEGVSEMPDLRMETEELVVSDKLKIRNYDIGIILCNALDNAIEACRKLKEKDREAEVFIRLFSFRRGNMFFLEIENSFDGVLIRKRESEFPMTDKNDSEAHGIGLYNIKNSAEKYHGAVDWNVRGRVFVLTVMLRNERE